MAVAINVKLSKRGDFEGRPLFLAENNEPITMVTDNADLIKIPFRMAGSQLFDIMNDATLAPTKSMLDIIKSNGAKAEFFESVSLVKFKKDIDLRVRFINNEKKIAKGDLVDANGWISSANSLEVPFPTLRFDVPGDFWTNSSKIFMEVMYDSYKLGELCCCDPTYIDSLMECDANVNCSQYECFVKPTPEPAPPTDPTPPIPPPSDPTPPIPPPTNPPPSDPTPPIPPPTNPTPTIPPPTNPPVSEDNEGPKTWVIILIVVIAVIILAIIAGVALYYNSSKTSDTEYTKLDGDNKSLKNGDSNSSASL